ncbi:cellulose synthase/poly-beta-1,6-N-acetylglucosamine synthase-like glycosyltransferase [Rhizobium azooxidifex]|uniref:Cellulose synthase/poly-beta-1,6-N-acetylglucosamine synthase-like glycosyltransferase n=1 Tax=Mycoplana azooxidifex TaxID=1636188 RepID=A0A7W6GII6_9HYPH|nr:glycosyltransferase [Mycoplana azooxidifex]MBB3976203.1 cellulose synthase/poly-beta-1,6-N-acetylglucosamine synthase-like glycosyltransferase [Mycoplana azooxidifex]
MTSGAGRMRLADYPDQRSISTAIPVAVDGPAARPETPALRPELFDEARLLRRLGFGKPLISELLLKATVNRTSLEAELIASGPVRSDIYYEALAEMLGLAFLPRIDAGRVVDMEGLDSQLLQPQMVRLSSGTRPPVTAIVPTAGRMEHLQATLSRQPALRAALAVTTPRAMREAVWQTGATRRVREATASLFETAPEFSARVTFWGRQGFYTGAAICAALFTAMLAPEIAVLALHLVLSTLFVAALVIRLTALFGTEAKGTAHPALLPTGPRPVYSVFVALYREAEVVPQLVSHLDRLDWPRSRLDIKLICEGDDAGTLAALRKLDLGPQYEIVEVPPGRPRTKPRALAYALPAARGSYLAVYDAEDRPHPGQLAEAWAGFSAAPPDLACLQAPLVISNGRASWISALFSLEYAGLFRRILPLLAARCLPMPLGGTSNHFRTDVLKTCGGWDPYNVTEDADLGMRLYRMGYRCATLRLPTLEDAPEDVRAWLGQRTRWFKGWLQTWLVLMRRPSLLLGEMGLLPFAAFQVLIGGLLLSALAHPLLLAYVVQVMVRMAADGPFVAGPLALSLFAVDVVNIFGSYAVFIALGWAPMRARERRAIGWRWVLVPGYWMLMSLAAWRAVAELRRDPFFWNKTAHRPTASGPQTGAGTSVHAP